MLSTLKLQVSNPAFRSIQDQGVTGDTSSRSPFYFRPARRRFASLSLQPDDNAASSSSRPSVSSNFTATVGSSSSPPSLQWNLTQRHVLMLNLIACAVFSLSLSLYLRCFLFFYVVTVFDCQSFPLLVVFDCLIFKQF